MTRTTTPNACASLLILMMGMIIPYSSLDAQATTSDERAALRYASSIETFLKQDSVQMPPKHAILFIGSSIFRQWTHLAEQMAPLPVFNRAFGGSLTGDLLYYMDRIVLPYEPEIIVYYCGSNDINAGERAVPIFSRIRQFSERVKGSLPGTSIYFVSINRAPQKQDRWDIVDSANTLLRQYCATTPGLHYIDVNPVLFDSANHPRYELYQGDRLHFRDSAYEEFAGVIKPVLEKAWKKNNRTN